MLEPQTLQFLKGLKKNNNKLWFDAHRMEYEAAKIDFSNFIQLLIDRLQLTDTTITGMTARECLLRINRDIRFSKDKTLYKTHFGASIKRNGRKSQYASYYIHIEPGQSFFGAGLWKPEAQWLKKVRQEIDYNYEEWQSILNDKAFKKIFGDLYRADDISLASKPKGYEKDHPAINDLKLTSFYTEASLNDADLVTAQLHKKIIAGYEVVQPMMQFINRALEPEF